VHTITLEGGTLGRSELQQGKGKGKQGFKGTNKGKVKEKDIREEDQRLAKQEGRTKEKGALLQEANRDSKAFEKGCYCTRFTYICFPCCTFCFEAFYIHLLQTGFPHGGFSRVMLTKNLCVNFMHA
jgi:hypothetical protein